MQIVKWFQRRGTPRLQIIERKFTVDLKKATHIEVNPLTEREEVVVKELGAGVDVVETVERRLPITEIRITLPLEALMGNTEGRVGTRDIPKLPPAARK